MFNKTRLDKITKYVYTVVVLCILSFSSYLVADSDGNVSSLTLPQAITKAISDNKNLQSLKETENQSLYDLRSSYGKFLPKLSLEAKYVRLDDPLELDLNELRTAIISTNVASSSAVVQQMSNNPLIAKMFSSGLSKKLEASLPDFTMRFQNDRFANISLVLTQPIFTGGKILANRNQKKSKFKFDQQKLKEQTSKTIVDVVTKYLRVKLLEKLLNIRTELVSNLENHKTKTQNYMNQGLIPKATYLKVVVALEEAVRDKLQNEKDLHLSMLTFKNSIGVDYSNNENPILSSDLFLIEQSSLKPVNEYLDEILQNNPNLKMLEYGYDQLKQKKLAVVSDYLPQIALQGRYELREKDLTAMEPKWSVGIGASWVLFEGLSNFHNLRSVNSELKALSYNTEYLKDMIFTEFEKYYHDFLKAREQYNYLQSSNELATENVRLNRASFNVGTATSLDVVDAELALKKIQVERFSAIYDMDVAFSNILRIIGKSDSITNYMSQKEEGETK